jgi:hypothetical protein
MLESERPQDTREEFSVSLGDVVEVTWLDHYRYKEQPVGRMSVKTWGKVDGMTEDGVALALNEVHGNDLIEPRSGRPLYQRVMDGQFIL